MPIKFIPESLREEYIELIKLCEENDMQYESEVGDLEDEEECKEEIIVNEDSQFNFWMPHSEYEDDDYTLGQVLEMVREVVQGGKVDENSFIGKKSALIRIDSYNREILSRMMYEIPQITTETIDGQKYEIDIVEGLTSYGLALTFNKQYNKYTPPVDYDDLFIEILSEENINEKEIDNLVQSYIFEIKSTLGIEIHLSPRPYYDPWEQDEEDKHFESIRLRPLLQGKGINELLKLYNSTASTTNAEILILTFTKVIEYVSQTVIQKDLITSTLIKLSSPKTLVPDATYILELNKIFEEHRNHKKDYAAIKLTIQTCCDLKELSSIAPPFLKFTKNLNTESTTSDYTKALDEVSAAISNTRNMFAHAKTNYELKGYECPENQLDEFAKCMDVLAQQIIRWFSKEHENNRVV